MINRERLLAAHLVDMHEVERTWASVVHEIAARSGLTVWQVWASFTLGGGTLTESELAQINREISVDNGDGNGR